MTEKKLSITDYGIYIISFDKLLEFLKENKIRSKKILDVFQKNHELYLKSLENGIWVPILPVDSVGYIIKGVDDQKFNEEWQEQFQYKGFNIQIKNKDLWIGSIGSLLNLKKEQFINSNSDSVSYQTLDGDTLYKAFKFNLDDGKYLLNISGYKRKKLLEYPEANCGYFFEFEKVDEFDGYMDPREDDKYKFNLTE